MCFNSSIAFNCSANQWTGTYMKGTSVMKEPLSKTMQNNKKTKRGVLSNIAKSIWKNLNRYKSFQRGKFNEVSSFKF